MLGQFQFDLIPVFQYKPERKFGRQQCPYKQEIEKIYFPPNTVIGAWGNVFRGKKLLPCESFSQAEAQSAFFHSNMSGC